MIEGIKRLLGIKPPVDYKELVKKGALIIDVRSTQEFSSGHISKSVNISVDKISSQLHQLKDKNRTIITCCASGMRSGKAKSILLSKGYKEVYNGGGWSSLNNKI
jgi:phage shock protein E